MSHGPSTASSTIVLDPDLPSLLRPVAVVVLWINRAMVAFGMLALLIAAFVLTYSVFSRYLMKASTDWQDEASVFLLVGATFLCSAFVQALRGHVGIEFLGGVLPPALNRVRLVLVDLACTAFCAFFAWKSWTLLHEAWVDGQTTSSSWAPPLWIPYGLMSLGMSLLTLQLLLQFTARLNSMRRGGKGDVR